MPIVVLAIVAVLAGLLATLAARAFPTPHRATLDVARGAGEAARRSPRARRVLTGRLDPATTTGLALTCALAVVLIGGLVLAGLAAVVRSSGGTIALDGSVARWGDRHATSISTDGLHVMTQLGEAWFAIAGAVAIAVVDFVRTRSRWAIPFLVAVILGDKLLTLGIKELLDRTRPDLNPVAATLGPSFPSGHSSTAAAFWAAAALVAGRWVARRAWPGLAGAAVGIAVGVAASRVLLDVHWLTDVLGGLALGWAWFAACAVAFGGRLLRFGIAAEQAAVTAATGPPRGSPRSHPTS